MKLFGYILLSVALFLQVSVTYGGVTDRSVISIDDEENPPNLVIQNLLIKKIEDYSFKNKERKIVYIDHVGLDFRFNLKPNMRSHARTQTVNGWAVRLNCSDEVQVTTKRMRVKRQSKNLITVLDESNFGLKLRPPEKPFRCLVDMYKTVKDSEKPAQYGFELRTEMAFVNAGLRSSQDTVCQAEDKTVFSQLQILQLACPQSVESFEYLFPAKEGFIKKLSVLTGQLIPVSVLEQRDLNYKLDMSNAPKLDFILISSLEWADDLTGRMLAEAVKFHAQRGTKVRIILPNALLTDESKSMFAELEESSPNIQLQRYVYDGIGLNRLHRVLHAKIFVTLSNENPEANVLVTGGRNLKDDYVLNDRFSSVYYEDLEIMLRSRGAALTTAKQVISFWNRDKKTKQMDAIDKIVVGSEFEAIALSNPDDVKVRTIFSIPYSDGQQIEQLYVSLFEKAKHSIKIMTPYFKPSSAMAKAMQTALDRGVKIQFITRTNLEGDNVPGGTDDVYKKSIGKYYDKVEAYDWMDPESPGSILHVKALFVDDELLFLGGVNFNNRSMTHDIESGLLIQGAEVTAPFLDMWNNYFLPRSKRITEKPKYNRLSTLLLPFTNGLY